MTNLLWYLDVLQAFSLGALVLGSGFYLRSLSKIKKQRKLSTFEFTMYIMIEVAFLIIIIDMLAEFFLG